MIGDKIKELRQSKNLTQVQFGASIDYSKQSVSNWENGNIDPPAAVIRKIAVKYGVTSDYLLELNELRKISVDGLTVEQIAFVQQMINIFLKSNH